MGDPTTADNLAFDECLIVDQLGDLDHGRRRADRFEELAVHIAGLAPVTDFGDVDPGPDHVRRFTSPGEGRSGLDDFGPRPDYARGRPGRMKARL
jgi:hypothetical protein